MFIEDALKIILMADPNVTALVDDRIYGGFLTDATTYPAVAFRKPDETREAQLDSPTTDPPDAEIVFFSVSKGVINGMSARRMASSIDKAIRGALHGYADIVIDDTASPQEMMEIQGIFFSRGSDGYDDRTQTHQYASVFRVRYKD